MPPSVCFRFIRTAKAAASDDDASFVTRVGPDQFQLTFRYKDHYGQNVTNKTILDSAGVLQWARRAIDMMEQDVEPFHQFQVDFPLLPTVLFNVKQIADNYHGILDALEFSLDNWPGELKAPVKVEDEDISDESDADESMPPLIPERMQTRSMVNRHLFFDE